MIDDSIIDAFDNLTPPEGAYNTQQRTEEWFKARVGKLTGSRFKDVLKGKRGAYLKARSDLMGQMIVEVLSGKPAESMGNRATEWGTMCEPVALVEYQHRSGKKVEESPFLDHPEIDRVGCSPDGLVVGESGIIEIKCPFNGINHLNSAKMMPSEHIPQVQGNMWVTGAQYCDFISFDPRLPEKYQLIVHRIERDHEFIDLLTEESVKFLTEFNKQLVTIKEYFNESADS